MEVLLDVSASQEEVEDVRRAFSAAGVDAEVLAAYERKGIGEFPWIVMITAPTTMFFTAIAAAAGKDAYNAVKNLVQAVWAARTKGSGPRGNVILNDEQVGIWIALEPDLPAEAYEKLASLDLTRFKTEPLKYDRERGEWTSPTGE